MTTAFSISTLTPHTHIPESSLISDITGVSTGLVVEVGDDPLDSLLFGGESASLSEVLCNHTFCYMTYCDIVLCMQEVQAFQPQSVANPSTMACISIVAKCPGLAGTVLEFRPMSCLCPGWHKIVLMSRNFQVTNLKLRVAKIPWWSQD